MILLSNTVVTYSTDRTRDWSSQVLRTWDWLIRVSGEKVWGVDTASSGSVDIWPALSSRKDDFDVASASRLARALCLQVHTYVTIKQHSKYVFAGYAPSNIWRGRTGNFCTEVNEYNGSGTIINWSGCYSVVITTDKYMFILEALFDVAGD